MFIDGIWVAALALSTAVAHADDYVDKAKAYIAEITKPGAPWTGPTTGPAAQGHKKIIFVIDDGRNSGSRGVEEGAADAAKVIGWDYRVIDGQGTTQGQTAAINQAIALKPDGIIIASVDANLRPIIRKSPKPQIRASRLCPGTPARWLARFQDRRSSPM